MCVFFFFKQKTAYEMRISDWSSDVCSSDLNDVERGCGGIEADIAGHDRSGRERIERGRIGDLVDIAACREQAEEVGSIVGHGGAALSTRSNGRHPGDVR